MTSPCTSIIVRCYNEREHIGKLLYGINRQSVDNYEIILVDSGSTDGTLEIAQRYGVDEIVHIEPQKFSFGRALNFGCEVASGDYCVFASAHVYPKRTDWLAALTRKFDDPSVALVYGKQRGNDMTRFSEKQIFRNWFPEQDIDYQSSPFCNNANAAIRRAVWEEHQYDEHLTGLEDIDWARRVRDDGYEVSYAADAEIIHVHDETPREILNRYRREAIAHKQIVPEQNFGLLDFFWMFLTNTLNDYRAALGSRELVSNLIDIPEFRFLQFWGTYRGFTRDAPVTERLWQRFYYPDTEGYPEDEGGDGNSGTEIDYPERTHLNSPQGTMSEEDSTLRESSQTSTG